MMPPGSDSDRQLPSSAPRLRRPIEEARRRPIEPQVSEDEETAVEPEPEVQPLDESWSEESDVVEEYAPAADEVESQEVVEETTEVDAGSDEDTVDEQPYEPEPAAQERPRRHTPLHHNALRRAEPAADPQESDIAVEQEDTAEPESPFDTYGTDKAVEAGEPKASSDAPAAEPVAEEPASNVLITTESPVLSVVATGPRTVLIGKEAEFLVRVTNSGAAANNVVVKVNVPSYADVVSSRATAGNAQSARGGPVHEGLEWTIDRLEPGAEETLTLKIVPRKSSPLDLAVNYTFTPETSQTMVEVQEPKLAMSLSGPSEVLFGQTKIYKLTISNPGNGDTHNVSVGLLPIGQSGDAPGTHKLGTLAAGESKTIDIELTARQAGAITIKAHSFADGGLRAETAEQVLVRRAELQVVVEAPHVKYAGTPAVYRVAVENTGDAPAENVKLSAILPPEAKFLAASGGRLDPEQARVLWVVGSLPAGGQREFELNCALNTPGDNRLQFSVVGDGEVSASATSNTRVEAIADLKLEVRDPQGPIAVGDDAVYEIRVRNRGTKAAEGVDLAVFFSEGLEPSSAEGGPHDVGSGQVVFKPIASIAAGEAATFYVRARASGAGNHVFRAEVVCESLNTKLAAEEATHFYGDQRTAALPQGEPTPARLPEDEPVAIDSDDPPPVTPREY